MDVIVRFRAIAVVLALMAAGCASPPSAAVDAAKAAVDKAVTAGAEQYAADSLKAAQDARAALDAELAAQQGKWFKSYEKTTELAAATQAAGDKAAADAVAAKAAADAAAARAKPRVAPVRVGGKIKPPTKIKDVAPVYPDMAQSARVAGAVVVEATIGEDGKVVDAKILRSIPMLDKAALDAVRQWEYTPTLLNGVPVPVILNVTITFKR